MTTELLTDSRWYAVENPDAVDSPALLVAPDRVRANIRRAVAIANGDVARLRPHVKTHKMRAVTELLLAEGIRQFKCATIAEAEMLAATGAPEVLLAFPLVGPKVARLLALRRAFPRTKFSALVDHPDAARAISAQTGNQPLGVFLDLNVGMNRTGVAASSALAMFGQCLTLPGVRVVGLHAYDGHVHEPNLQERTRWADAAFALAAQVQKQIQAAHGVQLPLVMGGTPTFAIHARRPGIQTSPGTFVFWDAGYARNLPDLPFEVAAVLLTRVISIVDEHTLTLDLGHKSVAAENPLPRVVFPDFPDAVPVAQSEEHLVVRVPDTWQFSPGEVWYAVPWHICPTVALYERVFTVENGRISGTWEVTARDRKLRE